MRPIISIAVGRSMRTKRVSCQLMKNIIDKHTNIIMGSLNIISSDDIIELSISAVSPVIRAITSPLLSFEKKPIGNVSTLSYT